MLQKRNATQIEVAVLSVIVMMTVKMIKKHVLFNYE